MQNHSLAFGPSDLAIGAITMRKFGIIYVTEQMSLRYGHEMFVAVAPLALDFHLILFLQTMFVLAVLFLFEMAKDGVI